MSDATGNKGATKFGKVFWPLLTLAFTAGIGWELHAGLAYHKSGGPSARVSDPGLFWFEIGFQMIMTLACAGLAIRALRATKT